MKDASCAVGVDLGGTKLEVALVDVKGVVIDRILLKTKSKEGSKSIIQDIVDSISNLQIKNPERKIIGIGVGIAGQINKENGTVLFAPNLNWHDVPLQGELINALKVPVYIINDVRAATWGEWYYGAGKGSEDILCLFVGTGIGGGIISGGKMLIGNNNSAGEVGHMTIEVNGPKCTCGNNGCFEALASGWAITKKIKAAVINDPKAGKPLLDLASGKIEELSPKQLFQLARSNDALSKSLVKEITNNLIAGIVGLVNAFNPQRLILGGGIINGYPEFIEEIRLGVTKFALKSATASLQIVEASLRSDAGVIGAAAFVKNAHQHKGSNE